MSDFDMALLRIEHLEAENERLRDGNRPLPFDRDQLGRFVREAWVRWAETQPNPKSSWLVPYDELAEQDKEADRQIGEAVARWTLIGDTADPHAKRPLPNAYIQWKGTDVCMDFWCECGAHHHIDAFFVYAVKCHECGVIWQMPSHIYPRKVEAHDCVYVTGGLDHAIRC